MTAKPAVTVAVDENTAAATLEPAGPLVRDDVRGRSAVARRAQRLLAGFTVHPDLADGGGVQTRLPHPKKSAASPAPGPAGPGPGAGRPWNPSIPDCAGGVRDGNMPPVP